MKIVIALLLAFSVVRAENLFTVSNIAALQSITDTNTTSVLVRGYYSPGDRGGGLFEWNANSTSSQDGGRYIAPNNWTNAGRWVRILNGETANVRMWGAQGNWHRWYDYSGIYANDDTTNIQNALTACAGSLDSDKDTPWTQELLITAGWYKVTDTLVCNFQKTKLRGENSEQTEIIMPYGIQKDILRGWKVNQILNGFNPSDLSDLTVRVDDFSLRYNGWETNKFADQTNSCLLVSYPQEGTIIRGIQTYGGAFGIRCFNGGNGAPFAIRDVVTTDASIAGVSIEPLPDQHSCNGHVSITGITGDYYVTKPPTKASLVRFVNFAGQALIDDLNAEGCYGAGVILHKFPDSSSDFSYTTSEAVLIIRSCQYNGSYGIQYNDFLVLQGGPRTATVSMQGPIQTYISGSLIRDDVTGRRIPADISVIFNSYVAAKLPLNYEGFNDYGALGKRSRLIIGGNAVYSFIPPKAGWYRVMAPMGGAPGLISGKLVVRSYYREGAEVEINVNPFGGTNGVWMNVLRSSKNNSVVPPVATKIRAFHYYDTSVGNYWGGVDLYVANVITNAYREQEKRLILSLPLDGVDSLDVGAQQLLTPLTPIATGSGSTNGLPAGATYIVKEITR